jgi:hypothetical protein
MVQLTLFDNDLPPPLKPARNDIRAGDAAEAFVVAKLLKAGFDAHGARRDATYDVGVDLGAGRLIRVQVKGRKRAVRERWSFRFVRGNPRTGTGSYPYDADDFDVAAVVSLSLVSVLFFPGVHGSIRLTTADFRRPNGEAQSWAHALNVVTRTRS